MTDFRNGAHPAAGMFRTRVHRLRRPHHASARDTDSPPNLIAIDTGPTSTYEAVTRQMVTGLADDLREIKSRLNTLIFALIGGILLDLFTRFPQS